jgi:hypothetical protein
VAIAALATVGAAGAGTFDFTSLTHSSGDTGCGFNSGSDICGTSLTFAQGSISVTATASYDGASEYNNVSVKVVQDYNGTSPRYVGLGVYHKINDTSDDNITSKELLTLTFNQVVTLTGLNFRAEGHGVYDSKNTTFLLNGTGQTLAGSITGLSYTGTTFTFGYGGNKPYQYYLSGMTVTAVPEPETYAMLLAGLGLVGGIARRRKQKASAS